MLESGEVWIETARSCVLSSPSGRNQPMVFRSETELLGLPLNDRPLGESRTGIKLEHEDRRRRVLQKDILLCWEMESRSRRLS